MANYDLRSADEVAADDRFVTKAQASMPAAGAANERPGATYKRLMKTRPAPEYDAGYWVKLRALYAGGRKLLGNDKLMDEVFPRHRNELEFVYRERRRRAFYTPYAGEIIDHVVSALEASPASVCLAPPEEGAESPDMGDDWKEFIEDTSPPGGEKMTIAQLLRTQISAALQVGCAWTLIDMPRVDQSAYPTRADQEKAGALDVWAEPIDAECILDWEEDSTGELIWACIHTKECRRESIFEDRDKVLCRWTVWTRDRWDRYEITHPKDKPPEPDDLIPSAGGDVHPCRRVPLVRLRLPDGLWIMSKLEGLAIEHFNKRCALSWAEFQSLFAELYEFMGPETGGGGVVVGENQTDPTRARNQRRGPGFAQERGKDDRAEFVGPPSEPFDHAMHSCDSVRDEMHRVAFTTDLAADNSAAALGRSGESKKQDKNARTVVLAALGGYAREHIVGVFDMASRAKAQDLVGEWRASGLDKFDQESISDTINDAVSLETVSIPSATAKRLIKMKQLKAIIGPDATNEDLETIEEELEENITAEMEMSQRAQEAGATQAENEADAAAAGEPDGDEEPPPPKRKAKASGPNTAYSSERKKR